MTTRDKITYNPDGTVTKRITNPDGTVTVSKNRVRDPKPEMQPQKVQDEDDWSHGLHPEERPISGDSAVLRRWERAEEHRLRRLGGHDGGPQPGDIRSEADVKRLAKRRLNEAFRKLRRDSRGSWTQAGNKLAAEALGKMTPEEREDYFQSALMGGGETGVAEFDDLYSDNYRTELENEFTTKYTDALYSTPDAEADRQAFGGLTVADPDGATRSVVDVLAEDRISAAHFLETTGQRMTGDADQDQRLYWSGVATTTLNDAGQPLFTPENLDNIRSESDFWKALGEDQLGVEGITDRAGYQAAVDKRNAEVNQKFREVTGQDMTGDAALDQRLYWYGVAKNTLDASGQSVFTMVQKANIHTESDFWKALGKNQLGVEGITDQAGYQAAVDKHNALVPMLQDVALAEYREDLKWDKDIAEQWSDRLAPSLRDVALADYRENLKSDRDIAKEWSDRLAPSLRDVALADYRENLKSDRDIAEQWSDRLSPSLRDIALADHRENLKSDQEIAEERSDSPVARAIWLEEMGYGDSDEMTDQVADALWMRVYPDYLDQARQWLDQKKQTERTADILSQVRRGDLSNIDEAGTVWRVGNDGSWQAPVNLAELYKKTSPLTPAPTQPRNLSARAAHKTVVRRKLEDDAEFIQQLTNHPDYVVQVHSVEGIPIKGPKDFTEVLVDKKSLQTIGQTGLHGNSLGLWLAQDFGFVEPTPADLGVTLGGRFPRHSSIGTVVLKEIAKTHPESYGGATVLPGESATTSEIVLAMLEAGLIAAPLAKPAVTTIGTGGRLAWQFPSKVAKGFTYRNPLTGEIMQQPYVVRSSGVAVPDVIPTVKLGGRGTDFIPITDQTFYRAQGELTDIGLGGNINIGKTQYLGRGGQLSELPTSGYFADDAVAGTGQGFRQGAPEITVIEYGGPFAVTERALVNMPVRVARPGQIRAGNKALRFDMDPEDYIPDFDTVPVGEKDWGKIKPTSAEMDDFYQNVPAGSSVMPGQGVGGQRFVSPMVLDPQTQVGPLGPSATVRVQRVYDVSPSGLAVPAPRLAALPAQQAGFPVPPTGTGAGLALAGAPRGGFGTAPESASPTFQNSFAPVPFSHIPAIRQGAGTWQSLLPGLAPTTGPDLGVAPEPAPAALSQGAIAPEPGTAFAPSSVPETVPTRELAVRQSLGQDVDLVTSIPQPPPMPVPQITTLNWALSPAPFTQPGSLGQFGGGRLGQPYEPHAPRPPSGRPPPPKGPPLPRPGVRPSGSGYWPGLGSSPQGYPQEVAVVLPPTVAVIDLATGIERRHLTGADRDVSLLVTQVGPTPRPNRELIGPHVDVLTDQDGRVGRREAKPVHHRVRAPRPQPSAAAKPKSGGQPRAQRLPSGPRIPRQIRQFARQANRNRR